MERKTQLWYLIGLTAATMMPQYALQGWLATGGQPADIAPWFLFVDSGAWALRAIIEAWALVFLFSTQPNDDSQRRMLAFFEIALIVLITVTLGPALASVGLGDAMHESLPVPIYWIWNFMVASYAPLMLGAAGFAFKVEMQAATDAQPATDLQPIAEPVESQAVAMQPEPVQVAPQAAATDVQAEKLDTATRRNEVARAKRANPQVTNNELASIFDVDASTIYRDVTHLQKNGILNGTH
jgi:hypothetical protein